MSDHQHQRHDLKSWPDAFQAICDGKKRAEFRVNDRNYQEGDLLWLAEWKPETDEYTGRRIYVDVTWIDYGPLHGIPPGGVVMSIEPRDGASERPHS